MFIGANVTKKVHTSKYGNIYPILPTMFRINVYCYIYDFFIEKGVQLKNKFLSLKQIFQRDGSR